MRRLFLNASNVNKTRIFLYGTKKIVFTCSSTWMQQSPMQKSFGLKKFDKNVKKSAISRMLITSTNHATEATISSASPTFGKTLSLITTKEKSSKRFILPSNIVFRRSKNFFSDNSAAFSTQIFDLISHDEAYAETISTRPLLLLFAWMLSKESHIEKYREFWFDRGYDVLSVRTSPMALLLPAIGGRDIARNVYNFLRNIQPRYDEVLVHAFSVGGYQFCEFLNYVQEARNNKDRQADRISNSLKGQIIDSCVFAEDCASGLSRAISKNSVAQPLIEKTIVNFLKLTKSFTMDRYMLLMRLLYENEKRIPGLVLYSEDDVVSSLLRNHKLWNSWKAMGILTDGHCWKESAHVLHYKEHQFEYQQKVDEFISKLNITKDRKK